MRSSRRAGTGLWLIGGGVLILASYHVLSLPTWWPSFDLLILTGGAVAGYAILGAGVFAIANARLSGESRSVLPAPLPLSDPADDATIDENALARRLVADFSKWHAEAPSDQHVWPAFDQFVRETLDNYVQATKARCLRPGNRDGVFCPLSALDSGRSDTDDGGECCAELHDDVLGMVARTGRPILHTDAPTEPDRQWQVVWPVRARNTTVGLITIAALPQKSAHERHLCETVLSIISVFWLNVQRDTELDRARVTDKASGVLTREDFFEQAATIMADPEGDEEPVVVAVLALEGLRGLDDHGFWPSRDALVEHTGRELSKRVRSDDIVGRFSDDRFVMVLRRLDRGLGVIIAQKLLRGVEQAIAGAGEGTGNVQVRLGLVAGIAGAKPFDMLLVEAFDAIESARRRGERIAAPTEDQLVAGAD